MHSGQANPRAKAVAGKAALSELEAVLAEQIALARGGDLAKLAELAPTAERLLAAAAEGATPADAEAAGRVGKLYRELCLILAAEKGDVAARLKRMGSGKTSLRAYGNASKL